MFSTSSYSIRAAQWPLSNYMGIAVLIALVFSLAWLQFRWLSQLSYEEEARRRVALEVAATNFGEYVSRELSQLLERFDQIDSVPDLLAHEPLLDAVVAFQRDGPARIFTRARSTWHPVGWAEIRQRLGGPLTVALLSGPVATGLWLDPPAAVRCNQTCQVALLSRGELAERLLAPAANRMFADFGDDLSLVVSIEGAGPAKVLFPSEGRLTGFKVTDLNEDFLRGVPVDGPAGASWYLKINHGGVSLEATVARSHVRNILLSIGVLSLLAVSVGLVISNARRQSALAREQLYFVAGITHELRTPLAVISTAADNMADNTVLEGERVQRYGELIQSEVRRLGTMIENVLQFAQSASATRPRTQSPVLVTELIDRVLEKCKPMLRDRELRLDLPETLPTIVGDPAALESALANLVANAARYAEGENWIAIRAKTVRVRPRGQALRIAISNPVAGRPDPHPERLFEPFYRGRNARARGPAGTGIGLAVARNVARQHGGGISVDAAEAGIITFTFFLPLNEHETAAHTAR